VNDANAVLTATVDVASPMVPIMNENHSGQPDRLSSA
jgi:hypothetical protein